METKTKAHVALGKKMNTQNINTQNSTDNRVESIVKSANYQADPLAVYHHLCNDRDHNLLLESAEIDKKHQLKSLLLTDAAVKITCHGKQVTFEALTLNGQAAVAFAAKQLSEKAELTISGSTLVAVFPAVPAELDEKSRLLATNPFHCLRLFNELSNKAQHPFSVFLGGVFAFDMMSMAEKLPEVPFGENSCPDFVYYLAETLVVIDHELQTSEIIANVFSGDNFDACQQMLAERVDNIHHQLNDEVISIQKHQGEKSEKTPFSEIKVDISDEKFCQIVDDLKENIRAGDIFQVVPSRTFTMPCDDTLNAYKSLKKSNPSPYMFYLKDSDFCIFGASPESSLKYQSHNRQVEIYPIAGTRPRGFNADGSFSPDLDSRIELDLRLDKKEMAEHIMLVDLARNDVARVSQAGTRHVADLLKVDRYSHVMHLVSRVCGTLSEDLDALHAYQACMNMGTLSGAPKVKATQLIRNVEGKRRGSYGGAVGYLTGEGEMDTCIVIRSAFVQDGMAQIQAGAGVVYDSNPQSEADETRQKAQAVISAINHAQQLQLSVSVMPSQHTDNKSEEEA